MMNPIIRVSFLFALGCLYCFRLSAQAPKSFPSDPAKYLSEVSKFIEETDKEEGKKVVEGFEPLWNGGKFTQEQQQSVVRTCNSMLKKRLKAVPDFRNYLQALTSFALSQQSQASFDSWQLSIEKLMTLPARHFSNYISVCNLLFRDNTLYESVSTRWYAATSEYRFDFDSLPKIIFPVSDVICTAKGDSSVIFGTQGIYYPTRKLFEGEGGNVNWRRAGLEESYARAELRRYSIDLSGSDFAADSAVFHCTNYFSQPLIGRYSDKILANVSEENASYPRFQSYATDIEVRNIVPGIDYSGGFSVLGSRIMGFGDRASNAFISIGRNGK